MAKRSRALVLSPEAPYPLVGGGQLRAASIVEFLRRRYETTLITFREPGAPPPQIPDGLEGHVIELPFHSKSAAARVARNLGRAVRGVPPLFDRFAGFDEQLKRCLNGRYDVAVIEHFWCASYFDTLRPVVDRLIVDLVDVDSVLLSRQATGTKKPLFDRFAAACRRLERQLLPKFDDVLVTSPADAAQVHVPAIVYPNTVPGRPVPAVTKENAIAFSGNMEYEPNTTGVRWFHRHVWPRLREHVEWKLIGRNDHAIRQIVGGDERIHVTGPVQDAVREISTCRAAVVPILAGSGTRVKIVEAWAASVPVVSTAVGAEGLPQDALVIADDPVDFADAVLRVMDNPDLARAGRKLFEERYTWDAAWGVLQRCGL